MTHQTNTDNPVDFPESRSREAFESWRDEQPNQRYGTPSWEAWQAAQAEMQREFQRNRRAKG